MLDGSKNYILNWDLVKRCIYGTAWGVCSARQRHANWRNLYMALTRVHVSGTLISIKWLHPSDLQKTLLINMYIKMFMRPNFLIIYIIDILLVNSDLGLSYEPKVFLTWHERFRWCFHGNRFEQLLDLYQRAYICRDPERFKISSCL